MSENITVLLFDVDGVLVDPLAYKAGILQTVEFLCQACGLSDAQSFLPDHYEIAYMEARGIHDVWDISNIMFALVLSNIFRALLQENRLCKLKAKDAASSLEILKSATGPILVERPDYKSFADRLVDPSGPMHPPDLALKLLSQEFNSVSTAAESWKTLLASFLEGTRSVYGSYGTRIFQNIILGSTEFETTYGLASNYSGPSLLRSEDRILINSESVRTLQSFKDRNDVKIAIYTARPSYPPPDTDRILGFSPEAEMAAEAAGMQNFPLVGMGMMEWLASKHGQRSEDLTKPNTTHSMAALLAALTQNNKSQTLERAHLLDKNHQEIESSSLPEMLDKSVHVVVFEDTTSGIKPMLTIAERLNNKGLSISVSSMGIASDETKKSALSPLCQKVFANLNEALAYVISGMSSEI